VDQTFSLLLKTETKKVSYSSTSGKAYAQTPNIVHCTEKAIGERAYQRTKGAAAKSPVSSSRPLKLEVLTDFPSVE
jgi:hypothetical protein